MLFSIFLSLIIYTNFLVFFANCEGEISKNQIDLLLHIYNNDILKNFEEIEKIKVNGTVSKYNILFSLKRYAMNVEKKMIGVGDDAHEISMDMLARMGMGLKFGGIMG